MAKIQLEGRLLGLEDEDTGLWKWLELDGQDLAHFVIGKLDFNMKWDTHDYGRVRITIEQLEENDES